MATKILEQFTVGCGCFWCIEAVYNHVKGVENVVSGYSGGTVPGTPTYREICSGLTGHAEVVQVTYDPQIISLKELLLIFFTSHDPTTLNRQGADVGTQYRSVIFYHNQEQKDTAEDIIQEISPFFDTPIVTEISELKPFFKAEVEHQNFYENNKKQRYCTYVIEPKLKRLRQLYASKLKK